MRSIILGSTFALGVVAGAAFVLHDRLAEGEISPVTVLEADVNKNQVVNSQDLGLVARHFGQRWTPSPTNTPTPTYTPTPTRTPTPTATPTPCCPPPTSVELYLDCDNSTVAIESTCSSLSPSANYELGVVLTNTTAGDFSVGALNFVVVGSNIESFAPIDLNAQPVQDSNPGLDEETTPGLGTLACTPPPPDNELDADGNPATSESLLACFTGAANGPTLGAGTTLRLAIVRYTTTNGTGVFTIRDAAISDEVFSEMGSCNVVINVVMNCFGASVTVGSP